MHLTQVPMPMTATATKFVAITACKICGDLKPEQLLSVPFDSPSVWDFLSTYYEGRLDSGFFRGEIFEVSKCRQCGFIWQAKILSPEKMEELYTQWIVAGESESKKRRSPASHFQAYAREMEVVAKLVGKLPTDTQVLDFGMGWGYWCLMAKAHGYEATGVEISEERIRFAKANGIQVAASLEDLAGRKFDFINSEQVFEHLEKPLEALRSVLDFLAPGGFIRIAVPDGSGMETGLHSPRWKAGKDALHPLEHINCFTETSLRRLGTEAGLTPIRPPVPVRGWRSLLKSALGGAFPYRPGTSQYFRKT